MRGITKLSVLLLPTLVLSGCWLDDDDNDDEVVVDPTPESSFVRVHHTASDAPNVNVIAEDTTLLENVPYQASSSVIEVEEGEYSITVEGILPDQSTAAVIGPADLTFNAETRYEIFAVGNVSDESLEPLVISNPVSDVASGNSRIQVVHAAYNAPGVDVYLTAPDAALADASPAATLEFSDDSGQVSVEAGDYRVRLTPVGETTVVYDSGTITLPDGSDYIVAATDNTATGDSPVTLQIATGDGTVLVPDANAGADVRVIHAAADAPNVDVTLNNAADPQITDLAFQSATDYINVAEGDYLVDVAATGGTPQVLDDVEFSLEATMSYSIYAVGALGDDSLALQALTEQRRSIATAAQLQVVHASPSAGNVDIYLTAAEDISDADPVVADVPFDVEGLVSTGSLQVTPGEYYATVTAAGTKTAAIGPVLFNLEGGGIYTVIAVDADGGGTPPQVILLDDLATPAQ